MAGQVSWSEIQLPGGSSSVSYDARLTGYDPPGTGVGFGVDSFGVGTFTSGTRSEVAYTATVVGRLTVNAAFTAVLTGQNTSSRINDARITSSATSPASYQVRVTGKSITNQAFDTRLIAANATSWPYAANLTARNSINSLTYDLRITGSSTTNTSANTRTVGATAIAAVSNAKVTGRATISTAYDVNISGKDVSLTSYSTRLTAQSSTSIVFDTRITGAIEMPSVSIAVNVVGASIGGVDTSAERFVHINGRNQPQRAFPVADIQTGNWHDSPLYEKIDEDSQDNTDYIQSGISPSVVDVTEIKLTAITDPGTSIDHIVRYSFSKDAQLGDTINLTIRLFQGGIEIASWTHNDIPSDIQNVSQTLTTAQANSIIDYSDLRLRFEAVKV